MVMYLAYQFGFWTGLFQWAVNINAPEIPAFFICSNCLKIRFISKNFKILSKQLPYFWINFIVLHVFFVYILLKINTLRLDMQLFLIFSSLYYSLL